MTVIDRLKMELSKKSYFEDSEYIQFLTENDLTNTATYDKETMQKKLLYTVIDILEAVANDIDKMRRVETEFETTDAAYKFMQTRIQDIKKRISAIPDDIDPETSSPWSLMFTRQ
jgi:hypothetical protein